MAESPSLAAAGFSWRAWGERLLHVVLFLCAGASVLTTLGIVAVLLIEALKFFWDVSPLEFFGGVQWSPLLKPPLFGVWPLISGTMLVACGSAVIAIPVGLGTAIFLSEYAPVWLRDVIKPAIEVLAGIPSVVHGYLAIVFVTPLLARVFPSIEPFNAASACIVVGIMILPMIVSLSEDVLRSVPRSLREAAFALGATKFDVTARVVVPAALSGVVASFLLAISRAIGETMAVTLAAGSNPQLTLNPLKSIQTMTSYIVQVSMGDTPAGTPEYRTIFAVGLTLFCITKTMNVAAVWIINRVRERYE
jgi:phosphate transport system permease protein